MKGKGGDLKYEASKEMWRFAIDARKWTGPIVSIYRALDKRSTVFTLSFRIPQLLTILVLKLEQVQFSTRFCV